MDDSTYAVSYIASPYGVQVPGNYGVPIHRIPWAPGPSTSTARPEHVVKPVRPPLAYVCCKFGVPQWLETGTAETGAGRLQPRS